MFKQLFLSTAIATAFIATPVLADDHGYHDEKSNHPAHDMEGSDVERTNTQGETKSYDEMDREEGKVRPDKKAYDGNGNDKHPAHEMGESDQGQ